MSGGHGVILHDGTTRVQSRFIRLGSNLTIVKDSDGRVQINAGGAPGAHVLADTTGLGSSHTTSGLTARQVLIATGATTALFRALVSADLPAHTPDAHTHPRADITGLPWLVADGGTGLTTWTGIGHIIVSTSSSAVAVVDSGADGGLLRSNGTTWVRSVLISGDLPSHTHNASEIQAGQFAAGNFVFPGDLTVTGSGNVLILDSPPPFPTDSFIDSPTLTFSGGVDVSTAETQYDVDIKLNMTTTGGAGYLEFLLGVAGAEVTEVQFAIGGGIHVGTTYTAPPNSGIRTEGQIIIEAGGLTVTSGVITGDGSGITTLNGNNITSGTVDVDHGGTNLSTWAGIGRVIVSTSATAVAVVDSGADGGYLRSNGTTWVRGTIVSGDLPSHNQNASTIQAGQFAAGNFVFPGDLTVTGSGNSLILDSPPSFPTDSFINSPLLTFSGGVDAATVETQYDADIFLNMISTAGGRLS